MECSFSGSQIKSFHRAVTCLAKIGNELMMEALPDKLILRSLNSSRSAFLAVTFKSQFFDAYRLLGAVAQCSVLLKSVCTVLRMPSSSMERLTIILPDLAATKMQWKLECLNGIRKTYWITCTNDPDMHHVPLDRRSFPSHLVVKPSDLNRLLANFQSSLQEITLIATEPSPLSSSCVTNSSEGKAIELRSYIDPVKETNDATLHTQLWIDPAEELLEYMHRGVAVDVTFSVKELKAFLTFCEGCETDMHLYFESAGNPILLAPRFGLDDTEHADFDATFVLATMIGSQLGEVENCDVAPGRVANFQERNKTAERNIEDPRISFQNVHPASISASKSSGQQSDRTKIWSEISGSATKSWGDGDATGGPVCLDDSNDASEEIHVGLRSRLASSNTGAPLGRGTSFASPTPRGGDVHSKRGVHSETDAENNDALAVGQNSAFLRDPGNWLSSDSEDNADEDDVYVQSTPPQRRGMI